MSSILSVVIGTALLGVAGWIGADPLVHPPRGVSPSLPAAECSQQGAARDVRRGIPSLSTRAYCGDGDGQQPPVPGESPGDPAWLRLTPQEGRFPRLLV